MQPKIDREREERNEAWGFKSIIEALLIRKRVIDGNNPIPRVSESNGGKQDMIDRIENSNIVGKELTISGFHIVVGVAE